MKTIAAAVGCLILLALGGCQARSGEVELLNARLEAEQAKGVELSQRAAKAAAAKEAAEKRVAELAAQLDAAEKQLAGEHQDIAKLDAQLAEARKAKLAADDLARKTLADVELLKAKLSQRGTLQTIDDALPADATIPAEIRNAFRGALAWRANLIRSLEIEIRDTPSRADARVLQSRLDKLRASPVAPPPLSPSNLTLGQIGPLEIDDHLRIDEVVDGNTLVVTPIQLDPSLTPQTLGSAPGAQGSAAQGSGVVGTAFVREEGSPIAIHGFPTKGAVTGAKLTALPGIYFVEKTQRYGSRTIFVLAPVDANKLQAYFNRLQAELRSAARSKSREHGSEAAAK